MRPVRTAWAAGMSRLHEAPSARWDKHTTIASTLQISQVPRCGRVRSAPHVADVGDRVGHARQHGEHAEHGGEVGHGAVLRLGEAALYDRRHTRTDVTLAPVPPGGRRCALRRSGPRPPSRDGGLLLAHRGRRARAGDRGALRGVPGTVRALGARGAGRSSRRGGPPRDRRARGGQARALRRRRRRRCSTAHWSTCACASTTRTGSTPGCTHCWPGRAGPSAPWDRRTCSRGWLSTGTRCCSTPR